MNTHAFLSFISNNYDFSRANIILSELNLTHCWKHWLTAELIHLLNTDKQFSDIQTNTRYPAKSSNNNDQESYLRYQVEKPIEKVHKKNLASYCDFSFKHQEKQHYFEIICANSTSFKKNKDLIKFEADITRIDTLKKQNPSVCISTIFAFFGTFTNDEVKIFAPFDNSKRCSYVLDSNIKGSSSIARLTQIQRAGDPRLCFAMYNAS
ncbi:hypothetical protein [Pseudoalteromonas denitrificans]|uniref:Uncharacterized protein n=1 Tax=Pseudoalteromonas denitrificans DSM 6059 TaxID=1123010 RepID=A0A1I1GMZ9_9GAMM|nr:hypothetical protein [Pseudoalteromonas denitrificans]SFC13139.1 hypothetical protein SAMN02745724_00971 [Pseudoalteromonas denitrificans DSM 6059]